MTPSPPLGVENVKIRENFEKSGDLRIFTFLLNGKSECYAGCTKMYKDQSIYTYMCISIFILFVVCYYFVLF